MACDRSVGVIGAGLGGLSAAVTLAARGFDITLLEKNPWLGGKAAVLEENGFRFDMGPTILTVPEVLRRVFEEAGQDLNRELDLIRLDPQWRCFFEDGSVLDLVEDVQHVTRNLKAFAPASGDGYRKFLALSKRLHDVSRRFFFWKPIEDLRDTINLKQHMSASTLADVLSLRMGATVAGTIRDGSVMRAWRRCSIISSSMSVLPHIARPRCCVRSLICRLARVSGIPAAEPRPSWRR